MLSPASIVPSAPLELPVASIRPNRRNPRRKGMKPSELQDLVRSINEEGLKDPITVRLVESTPLAGDFYEVLGGHRRLEAHRLMKRATIPAFVKKLDEREGAVECIVRYLHNEGPTPMEEALGYRELVRPADAGGLGLSVAEAARRTGRTEAHIHQRLLLCELPEEGQKALLAGRLDVGHLLPVARLPMAEDREAALARVMAGNEAGQPWTKDGVESLIASEFMRDLRGAPFKRDDANLLRAAGPCTTCPHRTGANPERFGPRTGGAANICTRPECYRAKVEASRVVESEDLEAEGVRVLDAETCEQEFPRGHKGLRYDSAYVDLSRPVPAELLKPEVAAHGNVTWQELMDNFPKVRMGDKEVDRPEVPRVAGFDQEGKVVHLAERKLLVASLDAGDRRIFKESDRKVVRITKESVTATKPEPRPAPVVDDEPEPPPHVATPDEDATAYTAEQYDALAKERDETLDLLQEVFVNLPLGAIPRALKYRVQAHLKRYGREEAA